MSDFAVRVEGLGKRYKIGERQKYKALRDVFAGALHAPARAASAIKGGKGRDSNGRSADKFIWALKDVSFEVKPGEVVGIIGRNGAGKSTLLKILSRITEPTEGRARVRGRIGSLLEVGTGFHPELTGRENVYLNGAILGMRKVEIERKFDEIVAFAEIEKFIDTPVKHYSSGMHVRLAFSVAAHLEPEILLVDEVLAVGDAGFQKKCLGKMDDVASEGRTTLFVSHNMAAIQSLCHRVIWVDTGQIARMGGTDEIITFYLNTSEKLGLSDLHARIDRAGKGQAQISKIEVTNCENPATSVLVTGKAARFVFHITGNLPNPSCAFTIYDRFGQSVASFNSKRSAPKDAVDTSVKTVFVCEIEELLLTPNSYRINAAVWSNNVLQDHVVSAGIFEVVDGYMNGRKVGKDTMGIVALRHRWILPG